MKNKAKKIYVNQDKARKQSKLACLAIQDLTELGLLILNVQFKRSNPVIEVANCSANKQIRSHLTGQGVNSEGKNYITKSSVFCGCEVRWQEVQYV